jgi:antitoxin CptB
MLSENFTSQRLRWACRRGMLELDLLLEAYLLECYDQASIAEKKNFIKLLECSDQDLFDWFMKKDLPIEPEIADMVAIILQHAHAKI